LSGRVLVVLHEELVGGASTAVLRTIGGLEKRGWSFEFWVPRPSPLFDHLEARGHRVDGAERPIAYSLAAARLDPGIAARARATPAYLRAFRRRLREHPPALVHANSHTTLLEARLARSAGIPALFHVHEMFGEGLKWWLGRRVAFGAGEVVAVSEACAARLASGRRRARVVRNGVELPERTAELSDGPGLTVGTVGVISRRKGTDVFVQAARIATARMPELRFELVGAADEPLDADWAGAVLDDARDAGITHLERADVGERMLGWDLFALPSRRDPFPLSMLEAMASGLPVIGAAVDGIPEQLDSGTGVLVSPEDPEALAGAIVELASDRDRRARLGHAARKRAATEFTLERQVAGIDAAYRTAIGSRR
jgi:glycosyltransferase involved in cell wall biosynthesis